MLVQLPIAPSYLLHHHAIASNLLHHHAIAFTIIMQLQCNVNPGLLGRHFQEVNELLQLQRDGQEEFERGENFFSFAFKFNRNELISDMIVVMSIFMMQNIIMIF